VKTKDRIIKCLEEKDFVSGKEIAGLLHISRQAINKHLKTLIESGEVTKYGRTRGAVYRLTGKPERVGLPARIQPLQRFRKRYVILGLEEHTAFKEAELLLNLKKSLRDNVFRIINYAFSEILNNAIEHSQSEECTAEVSLNPYDCQFSIRDYGIGIFYSLFRKFGLSDEISAVRELIKGKRTTMPERHTGEGVFFTSKSGDSVIFRSHKVALTFDNLKKDVFVSDKKSIKGTQVCFTISKHSRRELDDIFADYASEEFERRFDKTRVSVRLFQRECISRSEARRVLSGLDKFKEIILDFKDVRTMGQGFADEIFRVFKRMNPEIVIRTENMSGSLQMMINHVVDNEI